MEGIKIRDIRNGDWYWIHKVIYERYAEKIGALGLALYNAYAYYADRQAKCFPTQKTIAKKLGIGRRTVQKLNKILEENGLIRIESGKEKGRANTIYLLRVGCSEEAQGCASDPHPSAHEGHTVNKNKNNRKELTIDPSKEGGDGKHTFGNEDVNSLISFLKERTGLKKLDGSERQNRRYCWLCLRKFGSREVVEKLIEMGARSKFHSQNLTSFRYLYNHGVKIANELRGKMNRVAIIK